MKYLVLDVHFPSGLVVLLTREGVVQTEVVWVFLQDRLPLGIVQERVRVGHTQEQPRLSLVRLARGGFLGKQTTHERAVRGDTGTRGDHDQVGLGLVLGDEHDLSGGAGELQLQAGLSVAEIVRAHTLLCGVLSAHLLVPVGCAAHAESGCGARHVVTITGHDKVRKMSGKSAERSVSEAQTS